MRRRGLTLVEFLVTSSLLVAVSMVTHLLYRNATATIAYSSGRMDSRAGLRQALSRIAPLLATAYVPPIPSASGCCETPLSPYPTGTNVTDPLATGVNSYLFYTPCDLLADGAGLAPVENQVPRLFELRLLETADPDYTSFGRKPLVRRSLILRERQVPASFGIGPFPLLLNRSRTLARGLSDLRIFRVSSVGLVIQVSSQARQGTLSLSAPSVVTTTYETRVYFPAMGS